MRRWTLGYDAAAPKREVSLTLNTDLVRQCRSGMGNLSVHVENLLAADLDQRHAQADADRARNDLAIDAFNAFYDEHGTLADELRRL